MLAALHPSGTIHIAGAAHSSVSMGMMATDLKSTMKHNSSNHSIQSTKKMLGTIRKPTDLMGPKKNSNYMSPYSQKMAMKNQGGNVH